MPASHWPDNSAYRAGLTACFPGSETWHGLCEERRTRERQQARGVVKALREMPEMQGGETQEPAEFAPDDPQVLQLLAQIEGMEP